MYRTVLNVMFAGLLGLPALVAAADSSPQIAEAFRAYGSDGAFVTRTGDVTEVHFGEEWAAKPVHPASSFKVLLALIGLETGSIKDANEVLPWDGRPYPDNKVWEQDMALQDAMATSSESYFKIVAKRIGRDRLQSWVKRVNYGSINISANPETAWTDGVLTITATQQLDFMLRLANNDLPFRPDVMNTVKAVTLDHFDPELGIHGKTGTSFRNGSGFGWWVGWVDAKPAAGRAQPTAFAMLVTLEKIDGRDRRTALGRELLRKIGVVERRGL